MRVAVFVAAMPTTSETFILQHIRDLSERGHDVTVLAGSPACDGMPSIPDGIRVRRFRSGARRGQRGRAVLRLLARGPFTADGRRRLRAALAAALRGNTAPLLDAAETDGHLGQYDAVLAHFGPAGVRAMYLREAGLLDGPIATIFHGLDMSARPLVRRAMPHYRRLFAETELLLPVSRLWAETLQRWGAPATRIRVVHMGVELPSDVPDFSRATGRPLRVVSVARLVEKKGLGYAIAGLASSVAAVRYTVVGYGPLEAELRRQASASGVDADFLGKQPHGRVLSILEDSDVLLLPSVTAKDGQMEGIPVVLMEAMARGVLVVATRHAGNPELVDDGREGYLVDERDAAAIGQVLDRIAAGTDDLAQVRAAAHAKVAKAFNSGKLADELESLLLGMGRPAVAIAVPPVRHRDRRSAPLAQAMRERQGSGSADLARASVCEAPINPAN